MATDRGYQRLRTWLGRERDAAGLGLFRALFGALMLVSVVRFVARGWVAELYLQPAYHFTYWGFDWVKPWNGFGMYAHFALMGLAALGICLGAYTRLSALLFFLTFTYAELIDKTAYLNHYYLVSLLSLLLVFVPAGAAYSIDARRRPAARATNFSYLLLRAQVGVVYVFAGLAKLDHDWLVRGEPLRSWLANHADLPLVGPLFAGAFLPHAMSWAGAILDLSVVPLLLWAKTRRPAYAALGVFHVSIWLLFPVGVFSWVMLTAATVFFAPDWPRRFLPRPLPRLETPARPLPAWALALAGAYLGLQIALPLRHLAYPDAVNWTEQGFRFAWRVMLIEKAGFVEFDVHHGDRRFVVRPRSELTALQYKMMSTQPDMIHDYALHLAERYAGQRQGPVRVYARAWASLNGRPSQLLIDPKVDLAAEPRRLGPSRFIVPLASYNGQTSSGSAQMLNSGLQQTCGGRQLTSPHDSPPPAPPCVGHS